MFATGVGGVHAWEISITQFNAYLMVSQDIATIYSTNAMTGRLSCRLHLHPLWLPVQTRPPHLLPPTISPALVQDRNMVHDYIHRRVYSRNLLCLHLLVQAHRHELGRDHNGWRLHQSAESVHCDGRGQHYQRRCNIFLADSHGHQASDSPSAKDWTGHHLWHWVFDSRHLGRSSFHPAGFVD